MGCAAERRPAQRLSAIADITVVVPPIAATAIPPPSALARHTMSGTTPVRAVMPPGRW